MRTKRTHFGGKHRTSNFFIKHCFSDYFYKYKFQEYQGINKMIEVGERGRPPPLISPLISSSSSPLSSCNPAPHRRVTVVIEQQAEGMRTGSMRIHITKMIKEPMRAINSLAKGTFALLYLLQLAGQVVGGGTQFASHVSVNTPARSFTHGVGDPLPLLGRRNQQPQLPFKSFRRPSVTSQSRSSNGYPRVRPTIPFNHEDLPRGSSIGVAPRQYNRLNYMDVTIPILPASPYKVDSPDPESLWPEGLFLPPIDPPRFGAGRRSDTETDPHDPYLLEGTEAIAAVARAKEHGQLFFHDIPHIESLLANQEQRVKNHLRPHVLGSIRHTWPFYRT